MPVDGNIVPRLFMISLLWNVILKRHTTDNVVQYCVSKIHKQNNLTVVNQ